MKNKKAKVLLNIFIILIVLVIVLYFSIKDNYQEIINAILNIEPIYIICAILLLIIYRLLTSIAYYYIIKTNNEEVSFLKCLQINFIVLFFHGITPFSGGGQPMEVYYLHKEGIPITKSTNITIQNFIIYQIALVIVGILALIYNNIYSIFPEDNFIKKLVVLGFIINLTVLLVSYLLSFAKKTQKQLINKLINLLAKLTIIKDKEKFQNQINEHLSKFHKNTIKLKNKKILVINLIILNIVGLLVLYSMPYILAKGMNINISLNDTITATTYVMLIGSFIPIPGGTGGIEYGFVFFFKHLITGNIVNAVMLLWRFISYYLGMIFGGIALSLYRKKVKKCE